MKRESKNEKEAKNSQLMLLFFFKNNSGITLAEAPKLGEPLKITGVASVVKAESREEVMEELMRDPYYTSGIWDPSKVRLFFSVYFHVVDFCISFLVCCWALLCFALVWC